MEKYTKTILFLNLRFADFFSPELLKEIQNNIRIVVILDQQFEDKIPPHVEYFLHKKYSLRSNPKLGFLGEFDFYSLKEIVENELKITNELRIVCSDEFNLLNAARLREEFNLLGHKKKDILQFRDKVKMKELLRAQSLRVPRFKHLTDKDTFNTLSREIGLPFVIKPTDSCGSHGVFIIHEEKDFKHFEKNTLPHNFEVEEYIEGELFHVDALIKNQEIKFLCANRYTYPNFEYTLGKPLGSIPLDSNNEISKRLLIFAKSVLRALNANNLISHIELFVTKNDEIIFLEASARPPGGFLNLTHRINFGINLMDEDFMLQTGIELKLNNEIPREKAFFVLFPLMPGKIKTLNNPQVKSRYDINWCVKEGDFIDKSQCTNVVSKAAHAIFYNSNFDDLNDDFEKIKYHQALEVFR